MVIFGCGVVTGGLLMRQERTQEAAVTIVAPPKPANTRNSSSVPLGQLQREEFLRRMVKQLNLTPEQHDRISKIMHASQERTKPLWDKIAPEMRAELKKVREDIRNELTPEQQKKFADLLKPRPRKPTSGTPDEQPATNAPLPQTTTN